MPGLLNAVREGFGPGLLNAAHGVSRGMSADVLGAPVDLISQLLSVPRMLGAQTPDFRESPVGGSQWIGNKLESLGLLRPPTGTPQEAFGRLGGGFLSSPQAVGRTALALEQAARNAQIPGPFTTGPIAGQIGATVYHGSPHKFEKFDMSKIGTGEGAQSYGRGMYVADNPSIASSYARSVNDPGNLYKVDLPDEHISRMMDWDKPLSAQNEHARSVLSKINNPIVRQAIERDWTGHKLVKSLEDAMNVERPVRGLLPGITEKVGGSEAAANLLRSAGIPGIKYLDAGSRGAGTGTRNYVVFDESLLNILGRE